MPTHPARLLLLGLRIAALSAVVPVFWVRTFFASDRFSVLLTLFLFAGPYVVLAFAPAKWIRFQLGWAAGYSVSMLIAVSAAQALDALGGAFSYGSHVPFPAYSWLLYHGANVTLFLLAVFGWVYCRAQVGPQNYLRNAFYGFFYPLGAVVFQFFIGAIVLHS
jgi:hypothetical protein